MSVRGCSDRLNAQQRVDQADRAERSTLHSGVNPTGNPRIMKRLTLICLAAAFLFWGVSAALGAQDSPAQAAETPSYGAGAYNSTNPIGGGAGYVSPHGYSQATADYVVTTEAQLTSALTAATSGDVIWIPNGTTITIPNGTYGKTVKSGVVLASNRGQNGAAGGKIKWSYYGASTGYMIPLLNAQSNAVISGLVLEGAGGYGPYGYGAGPCAIRAAGQKHVEIENCEISSFRGAGIWFGDTSTSITTWNDDSQRNYVHNCHIQNIQQYGFGYGVGVMGGQQSMLVEACVFGENRHSVMNAGGTPSYEVRYCIFYDSTYANSTTGPATIQSHQVDSHGGGYYGFAAGTHLYIHHNTFSTNDTFSTKPNIMIRGVVSSECRVEYNWTKKTVRSSPPEYDETVSNSLVQLAGEEGGAWDGPSNLLTTANVYSTHNWYGTTAPPATPSTNHAPVLGAIGNRSVVAGTTLSFTISATDSDGDTLTYSASNLPSGATFASATRTFSWTPESGQSGVYPGVRFQVSDGSLTDSEDISINVMVDNPVQADINSDGAVNSLDMIMVGQHWGETGSPGWIREDISKDGVISVLDATLVGQHWTG
jgi:hypothetical protein